MRIARTRGDGVSAGTDPGLQRLPAASRPDMAGPLLLDAHAEKRVPLPGPQLRAADAEPAEYLGHGAGAVPALP